jgi:hypothetical protein
MLAAGFVAGIGFDGKAFPPFPSEDGWGEGEPEETWVLEALATTTFPEVRIDTIAHTTMLNSSPIPKTAHTARITPFLFACRSKSKLSLPSLDRFFEASVTGARGAGTGGNSNRAPQARHITPAPA